VTRLLPLVAFLLVVGCGDSFVRLATIHCPTSTRGFDVWTDDNAPCDKLAEDIDAVWAEGVAAGVWGREQDWSGYDVQFLNADPLPDTIAGAGSNAIGRTVWGGGGGHMAVTTALGRDQARATLFHEALHATYGEAGHEGWSKRYIELFQANADRGSFEDVQFEVFCQGYDEGRDWRCTPLQR
jgi:hypothetical protein